MGHHAGDHGHRDHDLALDRSDRHIPLSGARRSLRPPPGADLVDPGLCGVHRAHRLLDRLGDASDLELDHPHRPCRRESGRHADGDRDGTDQMARHSAWRPRRRLPAWLYAVLARRAGRGAAVGLALALLPRHFAGALGAVDPHRHQGEPALRARHRGDAQGGLEEAARYLRAGPTIPARNADRLAGLLLLSVYLDRLVGLDAVLISPTRSISASR